MAFGLRALTFYSVLQLCRSITLHQRRLRCWMTGTEMITPLKRCANIKRLIVKSKELLQRGNSYCRILHRSTDIAVMQAAHLASTPCHPSPRCTLRSLFARVSRLAYVHVHAVMEGLLAVRVENHNCTAV